MPGDAALGESDPGKEKLPNWSEIQALLVHAVSSVSSLTDLEMRHAAARGRAEKDGASVADHHEAYILGYLLEAAKIAQLGQVKLPDKE